MISFRRLHNQRGFTLVELVVVMIVISIALAGVLGVMNYTITHSADPMLRLQAIAIAEAYMEEITLKAYYDPDDGPPNPCPAPEASRNLYDNVCDYNGMNHTGAEDQNEVAISGLDNYIVGVTVASQAFGTPAITGLKIEIDVTDPAGESFVLTGYRAPY